MKNVLTNFLTTAAAVFGVVLFNPGSASALDIVVNSTSGDISADAITDEVLGSGNGATTMFSGTFAKAPVVPGTVTLSDDNENHTDNGDGLLNIQTHNNDNFGTGNGTLTSFSGTLVDTPIDPGTVVLEVNGGDVAWDDETEGILSADATDVSNFGHIAQTFVLSIDTGVMSNDYSAVISYVQINGNTDSATTTITAGSATPSAIALQLVNAINGNGQVNNFVEATDNMDGTLTIASTNGYHELTVTDDGTVPANSSVTETVPFSDFHHQLTLTGTLPETPIRPLSVLVEYNECQIQSDNNLNPNSCSSSGRSYVFSDDGEGNIRAFGLADVEIPGQSVGTIDYATGELTLTLGAGEAPRSIPDADDGDWYETRYDVEYQTVLGTVDYTTGAISVTFPDPVPNTQSVGADYNFAMGSIDYLTGAFSIEFNSAPASAADNVVVDYDPCDDVCSLRDAIALANGLPGADKITFDLLGDTITLQDTIGCVEDELTITGPGSSKLTIDAGGNASESYPILQIDPTDDNDCNGDWDPDDDNPRDFYDLPFTMTGVTLTGGHDYPWFFSDVFSDVTLMDVVVTDNIVDSDEDEETGSVIITGSATLRNIKVTDNTVTNNTSECEGGGISIAGVGGTILIENSTITGNNINFDEDEDQCGGAGLYMGGVQKTVTVRNTLISDNVLYQDMPTNCCHDNEPGGGGVKISGVALTVLLDRVTMDNNHFNVDNAEYVYGGDQHGGGGIMISGEGGIFMIQNSTINNNTSDLDGGGLHASSGRIYIRNTTIANNTAKGAYRDNAPASGSGSRYEFGGGGGIATSGNAQLELQGVTIRNNDTDQDGGGILLHGTPWFAGTSLDFLGGSISGNSAGRVGGGLNAWTGLANLGGVSVSGNHSDTRGGGISNLGKELNQNTDVLSENNSGDFSKYELLIGKIILTSTSVGGNTSTSNTGRDCWGIIDNFGGAAIATRDFCEIVGSAILFGGVGGGGGCTLSAKDAVPGSSMFLLLSAVGFMFIRERRRRNRA